MQNDCRMNQHIFFNFRKNNGTRNISRSASFNNAANDYSEVKCPIIGYVQLERAIGKNEKMANFKLESPK